MEEPANKKRKKTDSATSDEKKTRSSKACDQCRRTKCKCTLQVDEHGNTFGPCQNCTVIQQECTFNQTSKKRGPPKGYIDAVETRLHRMEALLGNLLENEDPRAQALLAELIGDDDAREMFTRDLKAAAQAGPESKARRSWIIASAQAQQNRQDSTRDMDYEALTDPILLPQSGPSSSTSTKPNRTKRRGGDAANDQFGSPSSVTRLRSPQDGTIAHTAYAGEGDASYPLTELADVVGQLSLDENSEIRYHGRSSGLYLISNSMRYQNFFWRFPKGGIWPTALPKRYMEESAQHEQKIIQRAMAVLPSPDEQAKLLNYYWNFVHPQFPILHQEWFQAHYGSTSQTNISPLGSPVPLFLLLVMFGLASRYCEPLETYVEGSHWPAGDEYFYHSRNIMSLEAFGGSHLSSVQGLLLMAYCQIGTGAMANSWNYIGQGRNGLIILLERGASHKLAAIRMSQDLGLFRDADRWFMPTMFKFSREEIQSRKRVWWGCAYMDKYVSSYIGRPMGITERDWDTSFPSEDEKDENEIWRPTTREGQIYNTIRPDMLTHSISCFNRASDLSVHISRIISNIYAIRVRVLGQSSESLLAHLDQGLAKFYLQLPPHLQYTPTSKEIPPPAVLTLHCQFFTALILLHRPFIPLRSDPNTITTSLPSHAIATTAANAIANIVTIYGQRYSLQQATPFLIYYVFTAAIMHVTNSRWQREVVQAKAGLMKCLAALEAMRVIWGGAARQMELLVGLVDFAAKEEQSPPPISTSIGSTVPVMFPSGPLQGHKPRQPIISPKASPTASQSNRKSPLIVAPSKAIAVSSAGFEPMPVSNGGRTEISAPIGSAAPHFPFANIPASVSAPRALDVMYDDWLNSFLGPTSGVQQGQGGNVMPEQAPFFDTNYYPNDRSFPSPVSPQQQQAAPFVLPLPLANDASDTQIAALGSNGWQAPLPQQTSDLIGNVSF